MSSGIVNQRILPLYAFYARLKAARELTINPRYWNLTTGGNVTGIKAFNIKKSLKFKKKERELFGRIIT